MSDIEVLGKVGQQLIADGTLNNFRQGKSGEIIVSQGHGKFYEPTLRNQTWTLSTAAAGVTVAAANVIAAAAGSPIVGLFNPVNSGKNLAILRVALLISSGTPGAGGFVWGVIAPNAGVTVTGGNGAMNCYSFVVGGSMAKTFTNSALTGSGASTLLRFIGGPVAGAVAANGNQTLQEETGGDIICPPGGVVGLYAAAAGTSPVVMASMVWEEQAIS